MIEPEISAPRPGRLRAGTVGVALLVVLGVGVAAIAPGGDQPDQLALAQTAGDATAERLGAPSAAAGGAAPALYPGFGGIEYRFDGELPDLGSEAAAWEIVAPGLDRGDVVRMAEALGLQGEPVQREGGWFVETSDGTLTLFFAGDGWSVNFSRAPAAAAAAGAQIRAADAEDVARSVLDRMGVHSGVEWRIETSRIDLGIGFGCASAGGGISSVRDLPADVPVADGVSAPEVAPCVTPEAPAPTPAQAVSFFPVLDGVRAGWAGWGVTVRGDGHIENLYGTWATFERAGTFRLRDVDRAYDELRSGDGDAGPQPLTADPASGMEPAVGAPEPLVERAVPPIAPEPQVVTLTAVERALIPMGVYTGTVTRLHLVPAYRFIGSFHGGDPFETTVLALHPDAIAPPPPAAGQGRAEPGRDPGDDPVRIPEGTVRPKG